MVSWQWFLFTAAHVFDLEAVAAKRTSPPSLALVMAEVVRESQDIPAVGWQDFSFSFTAVLFCLCLNLFSPSISLCLSGQWKAVVSALRSLLALLFSFSFYPFMAQRDKRAALWMWLPYLYDRYLYDLSRPNIKSYLHTRGHNLIAHIHNNYGYFTGLFSAMLEG